MVGDVAKARRALCLLREGAGSCNGSAEYRRPHNHLEKKKKKKKKRWKERSLACDLHGKTKSELSGRQHRWCVWIVVKVNRVCDQLVSEQ